MELNFNPTSTDGMGGALPPTIETPKEGGKAFICFEMGLGQEIQVVQTLTIAGKDYRVIPLASGPIAFDLYAPNGGKVSVYQADSLEDLLTGNVRIEIWELAEKAREIKGLAPTRRFVIVVLDGKKLKAGPRPLGWAERGPSVWLPALTKSAWAGV